MVRWYRGRGPDEAIELAGERPGWSPAAWRERLLSLAERCEPYVPERARVLRAAAELMVKTEEPERCATTKNRRTD